MSLLDPIPLRIWKFVIAHWRIFAITVLILFVGIFALCYRGGKKAKLDEAAQQKAKTAIAEQDEQKMREVLIESDVKEAVADNTSIQAKADTVNAIHESKHRWANASDEEIKAELLRRMKE